MNVHDLVRAHHAAIQANVEAFTSGRIDYATFSDRACDLHAASRADGPAVESILLDLIVAKLPPLLLETKR